MKRVRVAIAAAIAAFFIAGAAFGSLVWMKTFNDYYKPKKNTALYKAKCLACHIKKDGKGGQNAYGKMLEKKPIKKESLKAIENKDADKDGATNIKEIKAGKLPGDPKSKP